MTAQLPSKELLQKIIETANEIITVNNGTNEDISKNDTNKIIKLYDYLNDDLASPSVVKALAEFALAAHEQEPAEWATYYPDTDEESEREHSRSNEATARRIASEIKGYVVPVYYGNPAPAPAVTMPADLHPDTKKLVADFSAALAEKLYKAQLKYGYSDNWKRGDWSEQCLQHFHQHIAKGDPRDVAAYCAFMWYHGWKTESQAPVPAVQDDYFASLVIAARIRAEKAMRKFPQPNYVLNKVAEESGEVIKAVIHYTEGREEWSNVEGEIIDNLAMLIRLVSEGDQVIGFTPPESCLAAMLNGGKS